MFFGDGRFGDPTMRMLQVTMDTVRSFAASVTTCGTLSFYLCLGLWPSPSDAEVDPASPGTDRPGGTQFLYRGAGHFFTFCILMYLIMGVGSVQSRGMVVGRKMMHVLSLSHAENRRRAHPGGGSGAEHVPTYELPEEVPEELSEQQRAPAGRERHSSERQLILPV